MDVLARYDDALGIEWVAAMYEWDAALTEDEIGDYPFHAQRAAEDLENYAWEHMCDYCHRVYEDVETHMSYCEPMY